MAKNVYAPFPVFCTSGGVTSPCGASQPRIETCPETLRRFRMIMKLFSQLLAVEIATPCPLRLDGKISDGIAHGLRLCQRRIVVMGPVLGGPTMVPM